MSTMSCSFQQEIYEQPRNYWPFRKESIGSKGSFHIPDPSKLVTTAQKVVFHLNKAAIRFRQNRVTKAIQLIESEEEEDSFNRSADLSLLSLHLSSVECPSDKSNASFSILPISNKSTEPYIKITDLPHRVILRISQCLDAKSVRRFSQTCSKVRQLLLASPSKLQKEVVARYDIVVAFNYEAGCLDVRALKRNRTVDDEVFSGKTLVEVIPKLVHCMARITFGHGVNVYEWREALLSLYAERRLTPLALIFAGGTLSQITSSPARLLSFVPMLSHFGISFERPAVKFFFDDVKQVVSYWKHDPLSRSSTVYMRAPSGSCMMKWIDLGGTVDGCTRGAHSVVIPHVFQPGTFLTFKLH